MGTLDVVLQARSSCLWDDRVNDLQHKKVNKSLFIANGHLMWFETSEVVGWQGRAGQGQLVRLGYELLSMIVVLFDYHESYIFCYYFLLPSFFYYYYIVFYVLLCFLLSASYYLHALLVVRHCLETLELLLKITTFTYSPFWIVTYTLEGSSNGLSALKDVFSSYRPLCLHESFYQPHLPTDSSTREKKINDVHVTLAVSR